MLGQLLDKPMSVVSPVFIIGPILSALLVAHVLARTSPPASLGRFVAIDGLRGYLALSVCIHHSAVWYFCVRSGEWAPPPSRLYANLGQVGVSLFFMITAFLFVSKILSKATSPDWLRLYVSRVVRLTPMYVLAMSLMIGVVGLFSAFRIVVPLESLALQGIKWTSFTMFGAPDINGVDKTGRILAYVYWSLPYEWCFYAMLPLLALLMRRKVDLSLLLLSTVAIAIAVSQHYVVLGIKCFSGGVLAAFLVRFSYVQRWGNRKPVGIMALVCIGVAATSFDSAYFLAPLALLSFAFVVIASGNTLFGVLTLPASRLLGEISYGIYLLHGFVLFVVFEMLIGPAAASQFSPQMHWAIVCGVAGVLVLVCFVGYHWVEAPALRQVDYITGLLRSAIVTRSRASAQETNGP